MHEPYSPCVGRVCRSKAGRDQGGYFIITAMADDRHAYIADGRTRPLERPKKKKLMHLHLTPLVLLEAASRLEKKGQLANGELRRMLEHIKE